MEERCLCGWAQIARMFGKSKVSMQKRRRELLENGICFYSFVGRPPRKMICAFASQLIRYTMVKGMRGDII